MLRLHLSSPPVGLVPSDGNLLIYYSDRAELISVEDGQIKLTNHQLPSEITEPILAVGTAGRKIVISTGTVVRYFKNGQLKKTTEYPFRVGRI